jgi:small subunit ribosomal protein S25e
MGGVKRKSMAAMEKSQDGRDESPQGGQEKEKKGKEQKSAPQQSKRLPFLIPKSSDQDLIKTLTPLKAITVFTASKALGVNSSIANELLRTLENKKLIVRAGGFSGHYVWSVHH